MRRKILSLLLAVSFGAVEASAVEWPSPYRAPQTRAVVFTNSPRLGQLIRGGKLYLSLSDAVALAIENNLDVEFQRYNRDVGASELLRAKGGGLLRGLNYNVSEAPSGVGGPSSPLVTSPATRAIPSTSVSTNPMEVGALGQIQSNLSVTGSTPMSPGPAVPLFDPALFTRLNWQHLSAPQTNPLLAGVSNLVTETSTASAGYSQGFGPGTELTTSFDNSRQTLNSERVNYNPYTSSGLGITLVQPLLRGFGLALNRRYIRIANNENKIVDLLFQQQLIATVYGVSRLYYDYLALFEDVRVKDETLAFAQKLLEDTRSQVEEGTAASVELTRANAQVFAARQDLERSRGLLEEQEAILKNVLTRRGTADSDIRGVNIVPTETLSLPQAEPRPLEDLIGDALQNRPDVAQAQLQLANSNISLEASKNNLKPQLDFVASVQNSGLAGDANPLVAQPDPTFIGGYGSALGQVFRRNYPTYSAGIQLTLPLRNRVAQADAARDEVLVRQTEIRMQQLRNQVRLEVEDATIAMRRARAAYDAAVQARILQEQSLSVEQAKFEAGASTSFFVIQYQSYLAQARSAEVAARGAYLKAKAALERATGSILADYGISVDQAYKRGL